MRISLKYKILVSVLALNVAGTSAVFAADSGGTSQSLSGDYYYISKNGAFVNTAYTADENTNADVRDVYSSLKVMNNTVSIIGSTENGDVHGGLAASDALNNKVIITDSSIENGNVYGGLASINVRGNSVEVDSSEVNGMVCGGYSQTAGLTDGNRVTIKNSKTKDVYGAYSGNGRAEINVININEGSTVTGAVYGGYLKNSGSVRNNTVIIGSSTVNDVVYGGYLGDNGLVGANSVYISFSRAADVYGGYSEAGSPSDNTVTISFSTVGAVYGGYTNGNSTVKSNKVDVSAQTKASSVYGGYSNGGLVTDNSININVLSTVECNVYGGYSNSGSVTNNTVTINSSTVKCNVYGGYSETGSVTNNTVTISGNANIESADLYGSNSDKKENTGNKLILDGWSGIVNSINNFESVEINCVNLNNDTTIEVIGNVNNVGTVYVDIGAGDYGEGTKSITLEIDDELAGENGEKIELISYKDEYYTDNREDSDGIYVNKYEDLNIEKDKEEENKINISADIEESVLTGIFIDNDGIYVNDNDTPADKTDDITTLTIGNDFSTNVGTVAGAYATEDQTAAGGVVNISGSNDEDVTVYAGYSEKGSVTGNTINVAAGTNAQNMVLSGYGHDEENTGTGTTKSSSLHTNNALNISGNGSVFNGIKNFNSISFKDLVFGDSPALSLDSVALDNAQIEVKSIAGGQKIKVGNSVDLLKATDKADFGNIAEGYQTTTYAGVASVITSDITKTHTGPNTLTATVSKIERNRQTDLVASSRAVAAAFVNQGTDLISDSLDTISRDSNYGVKTFAAVHGNRSKYDVNSDIKINGWSTIVGVGAENEHKNGDFSWGVFYENGSGNYRTYNEFNNEFFRGDGSLVYNGGGIAARYERDNGVYTEGSLRAGMLKSEMKDALKDGNDKTYGYESESTYYGAHIGIGKVIALDESRELDVYGKFFHTYTEGDSFNVAGDEFEFDDITSDRLRIGARITENRAQKFSAYYGIAYEYEFNGDADMKAAGMSAPQQSLQGSSYMAEVGFNYQPSPESPWSFDLNLRGYAGEREGGSFNVQATYTF